MRVRLTRTIPTLGGDIPEGTVVYVRENARGRFDIFRDEGMTQLLCCDCPRSKEAELPPGAATSGTGTGVEAGG